MSFTIGGSPITPEIAAAMRAELGIVDPTPVGDTITSLASADTFIVRHAADDNKVKLVTAAVVAEFAGGEPDGTPPGTFDANDWRFLDAETLEVLALPASDPALTDIEISIDEGTAISLGGATVDEYVLASALEVGASARIRGVNSVGAGAWSAPKVYGVSALAWGEVGDEYDGLIANTEHVVAVPPDLEVGHTLLVGMFPHGTISSVVASNAQALSPMAIYGSAGEVGRVYGVVIEDEVPTSVTITLSAENDMKAQSVTAKGVGRVAGTLLDGNASEARTSLPYNSDREEALVMMLYTTTGSNDRVIDSADFPGDGPAAVIVPKWAFSVFGILLGKHEGATGESAATVTFDESDAPGGRHLALALSAA